MSTAAPADRPALPDDAVELADALRRGIVRSVDDAFAGLFLYGAVAFARPERWRIDFDFHVLLHRPLDDAQRRAIAQPLRRARRLPRISVPISTATTCC